MANNKMTEREIKVLDNHMTQYPWDNTFEDVLTLIFEASEEVTVWEPFECWDKKELVNHMRELSK